MESTLTSKGQATIPKEIRERLGLQPGDAVKFHVDAHGRVVILPKVPASALKGIVKGRIRKPVTLEEMRQAVRQRASTLDRAGREE